MIPDASPKAFWAALDELLAGARLVIDRPKGSVHPRYPAMIYPLDYGYLEGTQSIDGGGVDVWRGSQEKAGVVAVICTVDLVKRDTETKLLIDCKDVEISTVLAFHNESAAMKGAMLHPRNRLAQPGAIPGEVYSGFAPELHRNKEIGH